MKKKVVLIGLMTILLLGAVGCAAENEVDIPTSTQAPTETATLIPPTSTQTPIPTETSTPAPTEALSEDGPWLVYGKENRNSLLIRNVGGVDSIELQPPAGKDFKIWLNQATTSKNRFTVLLQGEDSSTLDLAVYRLPDLTIEFQTPLVTEEAIAVAQETETRDALYSFSDYGRFLKWSPDGRNLAYVSSVNFPGNRLMLYDTQTGEQEMLLESESLLRVIDWSPDGETLVYYTYTLWDGYVIDSGVVHALDLSSGEIMDFGEIQQWTLDIKPLGWLTNDRFAVINKNYEFSPDNLRLLDLSTGREMNIYEAPVGTVALDPETATFVFDIWNIAYWSGPEEFPQEIQTITYPSTALVPLALSGYSYFEWHPSLGLFSAFRYNDLILFDTTGEVALQIPFESRASYQVYPSPDGNNILVVIDDELVLMTLEGSVVQIYSIGYSFEGFWLPDSSGFYFVANEDLFFSTVENDWQPQILDSDVNSYWLFLVNP